MNVELESIARLELGKSIERISREAQEKLKALTGMPRGGQFEAAKLRVRLEQSEEICKECSRIWVDILEQKNGGKLTREDVTFIMRHVQEVADSSRRNLNSGPESPRFGSASETIAARIAGFTASIKRDLEVRLLRQQVFSNRSAEGQVNTGVKIVEDEDRRFARQAIEEARKSAPEDDRVHPKVGVVVVKDSRILASAHRGEFPQCHAEYIVLEKKLPDVSLAGATVYTTLEPCTSRNHPKVPCAIRLTERRVGRVFIGMLDPDDKISGRGQRALRKAGIATELFPHDLMTEVEELNRDFVRDRESRENDRRNENQQSPPDFYNFDGNPGPISLSGITHSVQGAWMDVRGAGDNC